jgi:aminoglycoside phosphotransferase (APT) family kinase protein
VHVDRAGDVYSYLRERGWFGDELAPQGVTFLAAGEYNENWLVQPSGPRAGRYVFRINHGSQLGQERQAEYEFRVLQALAGSGVTPEPYRCDMDAGGLGQGAMLMEYVEGRPLQYERDSQAAARIFARVHAQPAPERGLVVQADPVGDIAEESLGLIQRYGDAHPMQKERRRLLDYHAEITALGREVRELFAAEPLVVVNTEVNSRNFVVGGERDVLVDWEKAVVSCRYQDLGHFLVPTTTLWKTDFTYTPQGKREFLATYLRESDTGLDLDDVVYKTGILEKTILLRALSWCFMAWYEYTGQDRALANPDTFEKIRQYLADMECFLG